MPKNETKSELVGIINHYYYKLNDMVLYNEWVESSYSDATIDEMEKQGQEVCKETLIVAFNKEFYNKATAGQQLKLCFSAHHTLSQVVAEQYKKDQKEIKEYREKMDMLIKLVKGADTEEKINMLKELPLFN